MPSVLQSMLFLYSHPRLPVMVWLHGGGFSFGSGNAFLYGPDFLVAEDVVLVTLNYRLGPLGFLSVGGDATGNAGLKVSKIDCTNFKVNLTNKPKKNGSWHALKIDSLQMWARLSRSPIYRAIIKNSFNLNVNSFSVHLHGCFPFHNFFFIYTFYHLPM